MSLLSTFAATLRGRGFGGMNQYLHHTHFATGKRKEPFHAMVERLLYDIRLNPVGYIDNAVHDIIDGQMPRPCIGGGVAFFAVIPLKADNEGR